MSREPGQTPMLHEHRTGVGARVNGTVRAGDTPLPGSDRQELLWAILENLSEGVVACDAGGRLSFFNRATREFHGLDEEPLAPEEWSERYSLHTADGALMNANEVPLLRALRGEMVRDAAMVIAPRDRKARTVICTGRPLYDGSGKLLGAVVVMRDITDEIAAERQKADLVQERELNRAKDEFLATLSHELRNPLTSILAWTQMLQQREEDSRRALVSIEESARMQAQLIEDLSDIARIGSGKLTLNRQRVSVGDVLRSAIAGARPTAEVRRITVSSPKHYPVADVDADRVRLQQVFWNILTNALKFTQPGGIVYVELTTSQETVRVDIRDTGQGIDPLFLPRIFNRYTQGTVGSQGLGLGLSIARTIVELHGGTIAAASGGEGQGAAFSVTLPLRP